MRRCNSCGRSDGSLKRYLWNINHNFDFKEGRIGKETQHKGKPVLKSESGLLCDACAKRKGAWQMQGQEVTQQEEDKQSFEREIFGGINDIIESRTN